MSVSVVILGAGMMGTAIAAAYLRCGIAVKLYDSVETAALSAPKRIAEELRLQNCPFDPSLLTCYHNADTIFDNISNTVSCCGYYSSASDKPITVEPIIIETITEKLRAKQKLYQILQNTVNHISSKNCSCHIVPYLFSNTSTISISVLAEGLTPDWRKRFCGFHFFHPVRQRSLLEIIPGRETAPATVAAAKQHASQINKRPILVRDHPGFLVNRILNPYLTSALTLLAEGIALQRIELLATTFGMKMGPFRIMDEIGLDVVLHAGWVLFKAFPDRVPDSPLLRKLVEQGQLGRKTGQGFMSYPNSISWDSNNISNCHSNVDSPPSNSTISDQEIIQRLFVPMYEEAIRCYNDNIITDLADADFASIHALGFPLEKGGIVTWGKNQFQ
jgi:3-hydroxyacyl-CoA dehydrogenase/enoyl-CoA hydratase/3-hydroxybutyryl-CoA epimerase